MAENRPVIVLDCGSATSKIGYSSNYNPSMVLPSAIAVRYEQGVSAAAAATLGTTCGGTQLPEQLSDLDCCIGDDAIRRQKDLSLYWPINQGLVREWDLLERFWQGCMFRLHLWHTKLKVALMPVVACDPYSSQLRVDPEAHRVLVAQPPHASVASRATTAEVLFESLGVAGALLPPRPLLELYAAQTLGAAAAATSAAAEAPATPAVAGAADHGTGAVLNLMAAGLSRLTGVVVHCGNSLTHVTPLVEGCVLEGCARSTQLAGLHVTQAVQRLLKARDAGGPTDIAPEVVARHVKESKAYVCAGVASEEPKYRDNPRKYMVDYRGVHPLTQEPYQVAVKQERYLGPELLFNPTGVPNVVPPAGAVPLSLLVDQVVQSCAVDYRRALYANIVLTGGTSLLANMGRRLQVEVANLANARRHQSAQIIDVNVSCHTPAHPHMAFLGGSLLARTSDFKRAAVTREQYLEHGASIFCQDGGMF